VAGELSRREYPKPLTYEWLFFEYYLSWRYEFGSPNVDLNLEGSMRHVFSDPMILMTLLFFFIGIYAFFHSRDFAKGLFFLTWLVLGAISFFPSLFQLSYYYLGLFIPYFCIVAKGIHWTYVMGTERFVISDKTERFLISIPFLIYYTYSYIQYPLETIDIIPFWNWVFFLMMVSGYLLWSLNFSKTLPGTLTAGACCYFFVRYIFIFKFYDHNLILLFFSFGILCAFAYWLRKDIRAAGLLLIIIACMASIGDVTWNIHINTVFDYQYQEMASYIRSHGGDYNYSTRIFSNYHAEYCFGFYMKHVLRTGSSPFTSDYNNSLTYDYELIDYLFSHKILKYFVVLNGSFWADVRQDSTYTNTYRWFRENMVCLDEYVGIPWYNPIHLYGWGFFSTPRFADLDDDGDFDLILGNITGSLRFFRNEGPLERPQFVEDTSIFSSIDIHYFASPTFGDLDGDGDLDMLVGGFQEIVGYENNGSVTQPSWNYNSSFDSNIDLNQDYCITPQLIDLDKDGKFDLVFGNRNINDNPVRTYLNQGTTNSPLWTSNLTFFAQNPTTRGLVPTIIDLNNDGNNEYYFGDISGRVNEWTSESINGTNQWTINNSLYFTDKKTGYDYYIDVDYFSSPQFCDFDKDNDFDLVIGGKDGKLHYFENIGTAELPQWELINGFFDSISFLWDRS
ncbi:MAG: FG-GAP repeat domain-containing protein, partial [Candidatus Hodarchaeota archaeon]